MNIKGINPKRHSSKKDFLIKKSSNKELGWFTLGRSNPYPIFHSVIFFDESVANTAEGV